jgi:hypothetical protein
MVPKDREFRLSRQGLVDPGAAQSAGLRGPVRQERFLQKPLFCPHHLTRDWLHGAHHSGPTAATVGEISSAAMP